MSERIVVVVADGREPDEGYLVVQHLIHDVLNGAFDFFDACRPSHPRALGEFVGDGDRTLVRTLGDFFLTLFVREVRLTF